MGTIDDEIDRLVQQGVPQYYAEAIKAIYRGHKAAGLDHEAARDKTIKFLEIEREKVGKIYNERMNAFRMYFRQMRTFAAAAAVGCAGVGITFIAHARMARYGEAPAFHAGLGAAFVLAAFLLTVRVIVDIVRRSKPY